MAAQHIDFKYVREHAGFGRVLAHYNIELRKEGAKPGQHKALCPFHDDTKPSLKVNLERGLFNCFSCGASGNVLDFVVKIEGVELRPAALKVADICGIATSAGEPPAKRSAPVRPPAAPETPDEPNPAHDDTPNPLLTFELKLSQDEELTAWLADRGITSSAAETFGLGRASKRSKSIGARLAIPIHNAEGQLIAYCGRYLGDAKADDEPKYKLPAGFRKELELFNLHRQPDGLEYLFVFESYLSVIRHHEHAHCVSPFGHDVSDRQLALLERLGCRRFVVIFDGDEAGREGARRSAGQFARIGWAKICDLPESVKPHHLEWDALRTFAKAVW